MQHIPSPLRFRAPLSAREAIYIQIAETVIFINMTSKIAFYHQIVNDFNTKCVIRVTYYLSVLIPTHSINQSVYSLILLMDSTQNYLEVEVPSYFRCPISMALIRKQCESFGHFAYILQMHPFFERCFTVELCLNYVCFNKSIP